MVESHLARMPFGRTTGVETTRHVQQHGCPPPRRTHAEEAALVTLWHARQRTESPRQEPRSAVDQHATRTDAVGQLFSRLVPDAMWALVEPLVPPAKVRRQGGGRGRVCDRMIFTAIVFVLTSGCAWRHLPASFGVTVPTVHRRFQEWTDAGLWQRLRHAAAQCPPGSDRVQWAHAVLQAAERRGAAVGA